MPAMVTSLQLPCPTLSTHYAVQGAGQWALAVGYGYRYCTVLEYMIVLPKQSSTPPAFASAGPRPAVGLWLCPALAVLASSRPQNHAACDDHVQLY